MPRITPLRILLLPVLCWLLLAFVWIVLPSPEGRWSHYNIAFTPWQGGTLTRVYDVDETWTAAEPNAHAWNIHMASHDSFAFDSHYDIDTGVLSFGSDRPSTRPSYNLSALAADSFVSAPFAATVRLGNQDGVNMPWFAKADATLLFWEIHHDHETATVRLEVRKSVGSMGGRELEVFIWAHAAQESEPSSWDIVEETLVDWEAPGYRTPLVSMHFAFQNNNPDGSTGGHGHGHAHGHAQPPTIKVRFESGWSPSMTFPIRRAISQVMVPTAEIVGGLFTYIVFLAWDVAYTVIYLIGLYVLLVFACWAANRPPFWPWARSFWLTRHAVRLLGPPVSVASSEEKSCHGHGHGDDDSHPEESDTSTSPARRTPQPLTSVWAFFTSKSPLDDLLATFEFTKPFVQPLTLQWGRSGGPTVDEEQAPATSSGVGAHDGGNATNATRSRNASLHQHGAEDKAEAKAGADVGLGEK